MQYLVKVCSSQSFTENIMNNLLFFTPNNNLPKSLPGKYTGQIKR